jgi:hypothetical protein
MVGYSIILMIWSYVMGGWICTERSFSVGNYWFVTEKLVVCYREALRAVLAHWGEHFNI